MTTSLQSVNTSGSSLRVKAVVGGGIVAAWIVLGGLALSRQTAQTTTPAIQNVAPFRAADDLVRTPASQLAPFRPAGFYATAPKWDAATFRAEEHAAIPPVAPWDAVKFRAEEHAAIPPVEKTYYAPHTSIVSNPSVDLWRAQSGNQTVLEPYRDMLYKAERRHSNVRVPSFGGGGQGFRAE